LLLSAALFSTAALAQDSAGLLQSLSRMTAALRERDYQGALIYQHDGRIDALRLYHAAAAPERERLVSLNGPAREFVRSGGAVTCIQAGIEPLALTGEAGRSLLPLVPPVPAEFPHAVYRLESGGEERVAGYEARVVELRAGDAFRYGYRLWIEKDSSLPLRSALVDASGRVIEQMMFVTLEIGAPPHSQDLAPIRPLAEGGVSGDEETALAGDADWQAAGLPDGFALTARTSPAHAGRNEAEHLLYSDGIASVSVYIEPAVGGAAAASLDSRGALSVYTAAIDGHGVTVLGEVPPSTVERIGKSLRRVSPTIR